MRCRCASQYFWGGCFGGPHVSLPAWVQVPVLFSAVAALAFRGSPLTALCCLQGRAKRGELRYLESAQAYFDDPAHYDEISRMCSYTHPRVWQDTPGALAALPAAFAA